MINIIKVINGVTITRYVSTAWEIVDYTSGMMIDADGSGGNPFGDPDFQPDTSLHYQGQALNSIQIPYIVVPPSIIQGTHGICLGSRVEVFHFYNRNRAIAVVGDIGPAGKIGEGSIALANLLGIPPSPNTGGIEDHCVNFRIFIGVPALVNGTLFDLESYQSMTERLKRDAERIKNVSARMPKKHQHAKS